MAILHAALMGLQQIQEDGFYERRVTSGLIRLDEGHDRPVWEHLSKDVRLIPRSPETIMFDGLILLAITELGLANLEAINLASIKSLENCHSYVDHYDLLKSSKHKAKAQESFIDLSNHEIQLGLYEKLAALLRGHQVNVIPLSGPGAEIVTELKRLGIKHEVFRRKS